ncbi:MAG: SDR family oxidoreductase [Gammaproteobacteria bacterium]|nr:SDR family oxidoreductase [Gammaproteobacteria bacterium]
MQAIALVTGAASGIGAATARLLARDGYLVHLADIQDEAGRQLAAELGGVYHHVDVRSEADFDAVFAAVAERHGRLDCMVNNAAIVGVLGPIATLTTEQYDRSQAIIQRSVVIGTVLAARVMQPQGSGSIVNVASVAGLKGGWSPHVYAACKAAVINFTRSVALELGEDGVRINCVCPGNIATPIHTGVTDERWKARLDKIRNESADIQPIPRMGEPEEIAEAIAWLASDKASYVTGHALVVDGGLMAGRLWREQPPFFKDFHPGRG